MVIAVKCRDCKRDVWSSDFDYSTGVCRYCLELLRNKQNSVKSKLEVSHTHSIYEVRDAGFPDTNTLSAWHNVQEFSTVYDNFVNCGFNELEVYNRLCSLLKQRLGCKEVKVCVLMEGDKDD